MKRILTLSILLSISAFSFVQAQPASNDSRATSQENLCKLVTSNIDADGTVYCGSAEQWAEFDRRAALINDGVTCRWANTTRERCMTADQWVIAERRARDIAQAASMGWEARSVSTTMGSTPADIEATNFAMGR